MTKTLITICSLAAALGLFLMYTKPAYDGIQSKKVQIERYDLALDKADELQRLKKDLLTRYGSFNKDDIDRLHKLLPDHVDNVRLVLDLDTLASKNGLALQNISVSSPTESREGAVNITIGAEMATFDSLTMSFQTTGTYDRFITFLSELEESLRIVDIEKLNINAVGNGNNYTYDITLRTYWLK